MWLISTVEEAGRRLDVRKPRRAWGRWSCKYRTFASIRLTRGSSSGSQAVRWLQCRQGLISFASSFFFSASLIITARRLDWSGMRAFGPEPAMVDDGEKGIAVQEQPQQRQPDEVAALRFSQHQPAAAV